MREESRLGQRTVIDILDADQDVIDAKVALADVRRDMIVAEYTLASGLALLGVEKQNQSKSQSQN